MGAGAVGCYYGAMLARAGHKVTLIGRPQHVEAVQRSGLRLQTSASDEQIRLDGSTDPSAVRGARLVLFSVKSTDTEAAGKAMAPFLEREAAIVTLQNGVDNAERLAATLGREVIPAVVYVAVEMAGPGHVRHHGRGELVIGPGESSKAIVAAFAEAGVAVEISDNVAGALWAKLIVNCAYNALSAITQLPYGRLVQGAGVPAVMDDVVDECLAVALAAEGAGAGRHARDRSPHRADHAGAVLLHRAGPGATQEERDRPPQRLRGAQRRGARRADAGQPRAARASEAP